MLDMRLKLSKLMADNGLATAYALERFSKGRLPITTATRLVRAKDRPKRVDMETLEILCEIFGVKDMNALLARDPLPAPPSGKPAVHKPASAKKAARR